MYDILVPKMSQVLQHNQNQHIIEACLAIMKSMFLPEMQNSKKRLNKDYLNKIGFQGIFDSDSFTVQTADFARLCSPAHPLLPPQQKPSAKTDVLTKIACQVLEILTQ